VAGLVPDPVVCLDPAQDLLSQLPPRAVRVSLAEARALLRALLPLPTLDVAAALAWVAYQQRRKTAAYRSHRKRRLLALQALGP
jgi:hypothetical protein